MKCPLLPGPLAGPQRRAEAAATAAWIIGARMGRDVLRAARRDGLCEAWRVYMAYALQIGVAAAGFTVTEIASAVRFYVDKARSIACNQDKQPPHS